MPYELSAIEWEIHSRQIQKIFIELTRKSNQEKKHNKSENTSQKKSRPAIHAVIGKYKRFFIIECHNVHTSIQDHKIEDSEQDFIKYIATNYEGLLRLRDRKLSINASVDKNSQSHKKDIALQKAVKQINYQLQKLFVGPLLEVFETNFKQELITAHLIDSPIDSFLKAIKNNDVTVFRHNNYAVAEYQPIYSSNVNRHFILEYNKFHIEALYNEYLESMYAEFLSFVELTLEETPGYINKIKLLNSLKVRISSVDEFFFKDPDSSKFHHKRPRHCRIDACDNLKLKLHNFNILNDFEIFNSALIPLTEVQKIYISKSLKFIKAQQHLIKISRQESKSLDHQNQVPSNQLSLDLDDRQESPEKLQWRGNINQLITFFYDASTQVLVDGEPILNATKKQIVHLLTQNFMQKDGDPINQTTVSTILTPSKELKRPPLHKRITIPTS